MKFTQFIYYTASVKSTTGQYFLVLVF